MKEGKKKSKKSAKRGDIDKRLDNGSVEKPANPSVRPTPFVLDAASGMGRKCTACGTLMRWGSKVISYAGKSGNHYEVHEECYSVLLSC